MFPFGRKKEMLDKDSQHRIVECIKEAESKTTGEVRVYMEHHCSYMDARLRAIEIFRHLNMHKTEMRNGVLVYVALTDRQFAILGDAGIDKMAGGADFWQQAAGMLKAQMKQNNVTEGLCECIREMGNVLSQHFPYNSAVPRNQLPDEIVFGK